MVTRSSISRNAGRASLRKNGKFSVSFKPLFQASQKVQSLEERVVNQKLNKEMGFSYKQFSFIVTHVSEVQLNDHHANMENLGGEPREHHGRGKLTTTAEQEWHCGQGKKKKKD